MGICEVEKISELDRANDVNNNQNKTISFQTQSYIPNFYQLSPLNKNNNNELDRKIKPYQGYNNGVNPTTTIIQNPIPLNKNITPQPPNQLLNNPQINQMENAINKLKQQNEDFKVTLEANKKLLNEQTNAKMKLEKDLLTSSQNMETLLLQQNDLKEQIHLLLIENNQLKLNINQTQIK